MYHGEIDGQPVPSKYNTGLRVQTRVAGHI